MSRWFWAVSCWHARIIGAAIALGTWMLISLALLVPGVPLMSALLLGQTQILVFFLCLLAFRTLHRGGHFSPAGVALALAACLKNHAGRLCADISI